jgi:hypothetical protein
MAQLRAFVKGFIMGDRGNVFIRGSEFDPIKRQEFTAKRGIWIYGHWSGYDFPVHVRNALRKAGNYGVSVTGLLAEEGEPRYWEVSLGMQDNEYPIVFVDNHNQRVGFSPEPDAYYEMPPEPAIWYTFAEYAAMDDDTVRRLRSAVGLGR